MAVRVIGLDAFLQPYRLLDAEEFLEIHFDLAAREVLVAVGIEQTLFGRQKSAGAVHVDGAAFENNTRIETAVVLQSFQFIDDAVVAREIRIFASPGVECPFCKSDFARQTAFFHENWAVVAYPGVDGLHVMKNQILGRDLFCRQALLYVLGSVFAGD